MTPSPTRPVRPRLAPAVRRLWRDGQTLQLGVAPERAVVLAGVDAQSRLVLGLLDGTRDEAGVLRDAERLGCPRGQAGAVIDLLAAAGALDDAGAARDLPASLSRAEGDRLAPDLAALRLADGAGAVRRRAASRVVVLGAGRVGAPVAALLACSGVGAIDVVDDGVVRPDDCGVGGLELSDVGQGRAVAVRRRLERQAPSVRTGPVITPHLVLLTPAAGSAPPDLVVRDPTLLAHVVDGVGVVGPLVRPHASACLRCVDLHRTDLDPDWPALAAQLSVDTAQVVPCDAGLALAVAAQTAREALAFLDGCRPVGSLGGTLELSSTDWRWRRRSWQVHPDCPCALEPTG